MFRQCFRSIARETINLNTRQHTVTLKDEHATQVALAAIEKVCEDMQPAGRTGMSGNLKINTSASAWTARDHTRLPQLRQECLRFRLAVFKHPLSKLLLRIGERALINNWFNLSTHINCSVHEVMPPNAAVQPRRAGSLQFDREGDA